MASYAYDYNYDFETFAPKKQPVTEPETTGFEPRVVRPKKKSIVQQRRERQLILKKMITIIAASVLLFALFGARVWIQVSLNEKTKELSDIQNAISVQQSESVYLENKLNSMVNLGTVENIAVNKLHMVKKESSQIRYIMVGEIGNEEDGKVVTE